ncbi:hypothetical protein DFH07DRAFT_772753 [Mycena maculata]|uniref:BED-type domain-containing protein n=1 Tax=Mycena maculata TaxID=230809 RepID=A0AAD7NEQ7_9AGAR|nr:hypothetical protein DFH07DRAFT_772753 [Mycena maculata]
MATAPPKCASGRAQKVPPAPDKTPPPPPTPAPRHRQQRQPAPPDEPTPAPARTEDPPVNPVPVGGEAPSRAPDIFDDDKASAAGAVPGPGIHFASNNDDSGEDFASPPPSTASRPSRSNLSISPFGRSGSAQDVWRFFDPKEPKGAEKRECLFCKQQHAADPHTASAKFTASTSSGVYRKHLYDNHLEAWVEGCDQLKIPIKAKEAIPLVNAYCLHKHQKTAGRKSNPEQEKQ